MTVLVLAAAMIVAALFFRNPMRTVWGLVWGTAALFALAEFTGVRPALTVAAIIAVVIAVSGRRGPAPTVIAPAVVEETAMSRAWARLTRVGGFWPRNRIIGLKARYEAAATSTAECDPFSEAGELRIKLERYIPELIDNMLDDQLRAPPGQRRAKLGELLAELEGFVARMEAVDPAAKLRADRQAALRKHLRTGD